MSAAPSPEATLVEVLRWRAAHQAGRWALTFLENGEGEGIALTYGELDRRARAIAGTLMATVGGPSRSTVGERALLLYPSGLDFVAAYFGCLYSGMIAVPAQAPLPQRLGATMPKIIAIAEDARPAVVLTTASLRARLEPLFTQVPGLETVRWLATDEIDERVADEWRDPGVTPDMIAFCQYTSGSTTTPRGAMVSHGNLVANQKMIQESFEHTEDSLMVGWLPLFHDMGLVGNVLQPIYVGFPTVLMPPLAFVQRPLRWLQTISRFKGTTAGAPNFAYGLCARKAAARPPDALDLSTWTVAYNGSEPIHHQTLDDFVAAFAPFGFRREAFYPCYGLAEATLLVAASRKKEPPVVPRFQAAALERGAVVPADESAEGTRALVGCGRTVGRQEIAVVDPQALTRCAPDRVGEIWVSGDNVARGYWNRPDESERTFQGYMSDTGEGPYLRTGDLGFARDGELFITSRLKDLIIIDGRNHCPHDIEWTVQNSHRAVRPASTAALSVAVNGHEQLVVLAEVEPYVRRVRSSPDPSSDTNGDEAIVRAIRRAVSEGHDVQVHAVVLLRPGSLPKTSSGKIQRHACRTAFVAGALDALESE